jgi:anhydro-N-acetylmuramic acid kinase
MSGSSLDGLDIAHCTIQEEDGKWQYTINAAETAEFDHKWQLRLKNLVLQNAITYIKTHTFLGHYFGDLVNDFLDKYDLRDKTDFIASHGQTIFHQPDNKLTSQIGDGAAIAAKTGIRVISNFRTIDVGLGGQGTPIAPIADKLFFPEHKYCLNLGGIANISFKKEDGTMIAYDICGVNLVLNHLANALGKDYDAGGEMAAKGTVDEGLLENLNSSWYYDLEYPKSLSGGWVNKVILPVFKKYEITIEDKLATYCEHIAIQIAKDIDVISQRESAPIDPNATMLASGGGAWNTYLMTAISNKAPIKVVIPDAETINFKEALLMALMGVLRERGEVNVLSSVTGSERDNVGGIIYEV